MKLRETGGRRVTAIHLYRLVAAERGLEPHELPLPERIELSRRALDVSLPGFEITAGSDRGIEPVEVVPYDPDWPSRFAAWRNRMADALGGRALLIEHVGSTAVPGLAAKPVIDVQVSVSDMTDEAGYAPRLESTGLKLRSRDELHRFFRPVAGKPRDVHVHVCDAGSSWEREHLLFRDYLRTHADAADRYASAKNDAARVWRDDRLAYTDAKNDVILDLLEAAEGWAQAAGWRAPGPGRVET